MSKVILKNDEQLLTDSDKVFIPFHSEQYNPIGYMQEMANHDKQISFGYFKDTHFKFYLGIFKSLFENTARIIDGGNDLNSQRKQSMNAEIKQIWSRFGYLPLWFAGMCSLHENRFHFAPYGRFSSSIYDSFTNISLHYGHENGVACFKSKMRAAELLKKMGNHHLALISRDLKHEKKWKTWFSVVYKLFFFFIIFMMICLV